MRGFVLLLLLALCWIGPARAEVVVPILTARVTDLAGVLDAGEVAALEEKLTSFEAAKGSQLAVLIVPGTDGEALETYALRVAEKWQLGRKGIDDGILLLVALNDRRIRIEVGYGLEGAVPDIAARRIIDQIIRPAFMAGDYAGGVNAGVEAVIALVNGEPLPLPDKSFSTSGEGANSIIPLLALGLPLLLGVRDMLGRLVSPAGAAMGLSGVAGVAGGVMTASLLTGGIIFLILLVLLLLMGRGGGGYYGGPGFGGGFGGRSGGGFRGGGGRFGGGGASGGW